MRMKLHLHNEAFRELVELTANHFGYEQSHVEKDVYGVKKFLKIWQKNTDNSNKSRIFAPKNICENMNTVIKEEFRANCGFLTAKNINSRSKWRELRKLVDNNTVVKVKRGLYRLDDLNCDQRVEVAKIVPDGVFCLFTAWQHYNLTTYNPFEFYVTVRKKQKVILPAYPPVKLHYWIDKFYLLGTATIILDNQPVKIYDLEKSICDAVRFRNKVGMDMLSEILQNYLKRTDKDLNRLSQYSRELKIEKIMNDFITLML